MLRRVCLLLLLFLLVTDEAHAYGVLAHEAIIDAVWETSIVPILRAKFHPSKDDLDKARAYAYGGSLIQDVGYYPFSSRLFGDLTHYVRSGDFVAALVGDATDVNEYAFALGALAHYSSDNLGHPLAVNPSVALLYPKLRAKYGGHITYEQNPAAHLKTEFGFDVVQIARGAYVPTTYHSYIGFEVAKPVLERAFRETYGLELQDVFADVDMSIGTFRYAVGTMIPQMTKVAWETKKDEIEALAPGMTQQRFMFGLSRPDFEKEWGTRYEHPGIGSKILAIVLRIIPKIGPFSGLAFKTPTPAAEALFVKSFATTVDRYREAVQAASRATPVLENLNFDTGKPVRGGEYRLADQAHERLLDRLQQHDFQQVPPALRAHLLAFFSDFPQRVASSKDQKRWQKLQAKVNQLKASAAN
jgi:zinc dependent phospholipase C